VVLVLVLGLFAITGLGCCAKVCPKQVVIVSGGKSQLPNCRSVGSRLVRGGGTLVFPYFGKMELSRINFTLCNARTA
jgi:uncharacterized membrane protein YqiK